LAHPVWAKIAANNPIIEKKREFISSLHSVNGTEPWSCLLNIGRIDRGLAPFFIQVKLMRVSEHQTHAAPAEHSSPSEAHAPVAAGAGGLKNKSSLFFKQLKELLHGINEGLLSKDRPTRRMSLLFYLSVLGAFLILVIGSVSYYQERKARQHGEEALRAAEQMNEFFKRQSEIAKKKSAQMKLGNFTIGLKLPPGQRRVKGVSNMAEVELTLECDSRETKDYIESHIEQAKGQVTNAFTAMYREELMSKDGKDRLKKIILDRLNAWLPDGKVTDAFFTRMLIS
jgi:flagellar basal body-associated protein FliL